MKIFDTHSHYDDVKFEALDNGNREQFVRTLISEQNVAGMIGASVDIPSCKAHLALADKIEDYYAALGFHPENIPEGADVNTCMTELEKLLDHPKAVAIGEIGLDYYWEENPPIDIQKLFFESQIQLAKKRNLPIIVHDREAHGDTLEILKANRGARGVLHSYSGSYESGVELIKEGFLLSFTGVVTFKNATRVREIVSRLPLECMMLETDCPYMAPVPMRGKINHSGYLCYTAEKIAEIKNVAVEKVIEISNENAKKLFNIKIQD